MTIQRRNKSVKSKQYKTAGLYFTLVIGLFMFLAFMAHDWLSDATDISVIIIGTKITNTNEILQLARITDTVSLNSTNLMELKRRVEKNPYIRTVVITTSPPNIVYIEVEERTPFAHLLKYNEEDCLLDQDGIIMPSHTDSYSDNLPIITGKNLHGKTVGSGQRIRSRKIEDALFVLRYAKKLSPILFVQISEIYLRSGSDMILYTTDGAIPVIYGSVDRSHEKLTALQAFLSDEAVGAENSRLSYIDVRFKRQVVAHWNKDTIHSNVLHASAVDSITGIE